MLLPRNCPKANTRISLKSRGTSFDKGVLFILKVAPVQQKGGEAGGKSNQAGVESHDANVK